MKTHTLLTTLAVVLAFSFPCLGTAKESKKKHNPTPPAAEGTPATPPDGRTKQQEKRTRFLAEKNANNDFLNSPDGIVFKKQLAALDDELNATYEKYVNISREDPATDKGKQMHAERDRQFQVLNQKRAKAEADYEALKNSSPVFHAMLQKRLDNPKKKGKSKSKAPEEEEEEN